MNIITQIALSMLALFGLYVFIRFLLSRTGRKTLSESGCVVGEDEIKIFASAESLEFCIRAALTESVFDEKKIIVNISRFSPDREKMMYIAEQFRKKHRNISIKKM